MKREIFLLLFTGLLFFGTGGFHRAYGMDTEECLACHMDSDIVGDALLVTDSFSRTPHADLGCSACHEAMDEHPDDGEEVAGLGCEYCHDEISAEYLKTEHADYVSCTDCHNPHAARGLAVSSGDAMDQQCFRCHDRDESLDRHARWLPLTDLHIARISCVTCHTRILDYAIDLHLIRQDRVTGGRLNSRICNYDELKDYLGTDDLAGLIDTNRDQYISLDELRSFNRHPEYAALHLDGILIPLKMSHQIGTLDSRYDCSFCHEPGPERMQTSFLVLPNADGSFLHIPVEQGAVINATHGIPDFYMVGSTRNASLDLAGLILICAGLIMPVVHGTLRFLTRKNRRH